MKRIFVLAVTTATMLLASCGASKKTVSMDYPHQQRPAQQQQSNQKFDSGMIDYGFGRSGDKGKAYRDALRNAQQNAATRLYRVLSSVDTDFGQDIAMGENLQSMSKRSERFVGIIDDKIVMIRNNKEPKFEQNQGIWSCEVEIIVDNSLADAVAQSIYSSLPDDDALKVKFEEHQFKEEFEKELAAYRQRQGKL